MEQYMWHIIGIGSFSFVQALLIAGLVVQLVRRKRVEEALSEKELRLRESQAIAHVGSFHWDVVANTVAWSDELHRIYGFEPGEPSMTYETYLKQVHPDHLEQVRGAVERALINREPFGHEYRIVRPTGETRWVFAQGRPMVDAGGTLIALQGICQDITERKRAEAANLRRAALRADVNAALAEREGSLQSAIQQCAEAMVRHLDAAFARIWTLDHKERVLELQASAGLYTHLNGSHSRVPVGELKIGLIAKERQPHLTDDVCNDPRVNDREWARDQGMAAFAGYPLLVEDRVVGVMAMFARYPLTEDTLEALATVAAPIAQGIERKRAEQALREGEERLRLALEAGRMGVWEWDTRTNAVKWSKEHYMIMGLPPFSVEPDYYTWADRVHPEDLPVAMKMMSRAIEEKGEYRQEYRIIWPDESVRWVEGRAKPVYDEGGQCLKVSGLIVDVTERKQAEDALRRSEARYRAIVEDQTELICRLLPDGSLTFVNEAYCRYFGRSLEELIGGAFLPFIPAEEEERINQFLAAITPSNPVATIEHRVVLPDGGVRWHQWTDRGIFDEQGRLIEFQCVGRDVTQRKQAEDRLMESEAQLRLLTELIPQHVWTAFPGNTADYRNQRWLDYTGMTIEEVRQKGWMAALHPDDHEPVFNAIREASSQKRTYEVEVRLRRSDGQYRWFLARAIHQLDQEGNIIKWYGTNTDIEDRKQAEEALRDSEQRFRQLAENIGAAFFITEGFSETSPGQILYVSPAYEKIWGRSRESVYQDTRSWLEAVHYEDRERVLAALRGMEATQFDEEFRIVRPDGEVRWVHDRVFPIRDERGGIYRLAGIVEDITGRKQIEEALRESEEALRKSYARIEDLAGRLIVAQEEERKNIARELHDDLNQQVAALAIGISRLKRQLPDAGAAVQEQIGKLREKTDWLSERIRQVSHELHSSILQHVGLPAALNSYCEEFSDREGIAVTLDIRDGVEAVPPDAALCLYRVAQESLRNVARHSGARSAIVALAGVNGAIELRVADQGVGFDPGQAREGCGLGLLSMEERVKLLDGSFVLMTRPGAGTELRAHIPLRGEHEQNKSTAG